MGGPADVGRHDHVGMTEQAMLACPIALPHDVQCRPRQPARGQGGVEGVFVNEGLTGRVDKKRPRFHPGKSGLVEQVLVLISRPGVQRYEVGPLQQLVEPPYAFDLVVRFNTPGKGRR